MAVFRIERTKDYTVMSNHHLRNHELSLKAKGLLSMMLSLPDDWNYTSGNSMAPQVFVWQYPDVFNSFSFCVCCYENKRICRPDDWLCRDCHGKCRTFKSRMGSVVSVDSHLFLGAG